MTRKPKRQQLFFSRALKHFSRKVKLDLQLISHSTLLILGLRVTCHAQRRRGVRGEQGVDVH